MMLRRLDAGLATFALLLAATTNADARQITLAWDASSEAVAGYILCYGTESRDVAEYPCSVDVGNLLSAQLDLPGDQYYFSVRAYDTEGNLSPFSLEVADAADVVLTNPGDQSHMAGELVGLQLISRGTAVSYSATNLPPGLSVDATTGRIGGILDPAATMSSVHLVTARVSDPSGHISSVQFMWTLKVNHAPTITNPGSQSAIAGGVGRFAIAASDDDGDVLSYSAIGLPTGLSIDAATGIISGTVASDAAGVFNVTVTASDGMLSTPIEFPWVVAAPGTLAVDQVVFADSIGSDVITTPAFSTSVAGETLLAFVTAAQPTIEDSPVSGGGLTWTLVTRANFQSGTAEIWTATASQLLSDVVVTASMGSTMSGSLTVVTFAGSAGIGASAIAGAAVGPPLVSLTTTTAGSLVYGAGNDWDGAIARTVGANQAMVHEWVSTETGDTYWVQNAVGPVLAAGTIVTLSDIAPIEHQWNFAAVEILPRVQRRPSVTASPTIVVPGTTITATVADGPGNTTDWVGLFKVDAGSPAFNAWSYLNGSQTPPAAGLTHATIDFAAPKTPGLYNIRLFAAGDPLTPIATSNNVLVPSTLEIGNGFVREGHNGTANAEFIVTLRPASPVDVTVSYTTADGSATSGSDYAARAGTLTFPAGTTTQTISVAVVGDTAIEPNETFVVNLSNPINAVIRDSQGWGTIVNDDLPVLTIDNVTVLEGNRGTTGAVFTVRLSSAVSDKVTVKYATANGTAKVGSDYVAVSGKLTFAAGVTTRTITVPVVGDTFVEPNETFFVTLSGARRATLADAQGVGTIVNDDASHEGRMFGIGRIDEGRTHHHFVFRVSERNHREYGRLEFWSTTGRNCDDDDHNRDGGHDSDFGRDHRRALGRFESTAIGSVTFSDDPSVTPGRGRQEPMMDSVVFAGTGKWNGQSGYTFEVRATDQGEPGRQRDTFSLVVKNGRGTSVMSTSGKIDGGNTQSTRLAKLGIWD